jgi:periplasmic divalent cation tolerance protein
MMHENGGALYRSFRHRDRHRDRNRSRLFRIRITNLDTDSDAECYGLSLFSEQIDMNEILVISTADTLELAQQIAFTLVQECEAACVNIVPGIRSIYRWEGKICDDGEFLILVKSSTERFEAIRSRIRRMHTYQVPEVIAIPISAGDLDYLNWLHTSIGDFA